MMARKMVILGLLEIAFLLIRVSSAIGQGQVFWQENGVLICDGTREGYVAIAEDGIGGAIISWADERNGGSIYAQRVDSSGGCLWMPDGVEVYSPSLFPRNLKSVSDEREGAIIIWEHFYGGEQGIYAARVDGNGIVWWAILVCPSDSTQQYPGVVSDGAGGAIIAWVDRRSGNWDIYAQRLDSSGVLKWPSGGVPICTGMNASQWFTSMAGDGYGGSVITWADTRNGNEDIYAQRVDSGGTVLWQVGGVYICTADSIQFAPQIVGDRSGGGIAVWHDKRTGDWDIYGQRITGNGDPSWAADGAVICSVGSAQAGTRITHGGDQGAVIIWLDFRNGNWDIYGQKVDSTGTLQWDSVGVAICTTDSSEGQYQIETDERGGGIVAWQDYRAGNWDIYCQRVDSAGMLTWDSVGLAVCTDSAGQAGVVMVPDGRGGAIIAWADGRPPGLPGSVYAQRVGDMVGVEEEQNAGHRKPEAILFLNRPNPFGASGTRIKFRVESSALTLSLQVYDVAGRLIKTLLEGEQKAGSYEVMWDGRDDSGRSLPSGIYFCELRTSGSKEVRKAVLMRT